MARADLVQNQERFVRVPRRDRRVHGDDRLIGAGNSGDATDLGAELRIDHGGGQRWLGQRRHRMWLFVRHQPRAEVDVQRRVVATRPTAPGRPARRLRAAARRRPSRRKRAAGPVGSSRCPLRACPAGSRGIPRSSARQRQGQWSNQTNPFAPYHADHRTTSRAAPRSRNLVQR